MLVHDSASYLSTFMPLETIRDEECPDDLRDAIWDGRDVIEWHRIQATAPPSQILTTSPIRPWTV